MRRRQRDVRGSLLCCLHLRHPTLSLAEMLITSIQISSQPLSLSLKSFLSGGSLLSALSIPLGLHSALSMGFIGGLAHSVATNLPLEGKLFTNQNRSRVSVLTLAYHISMCPVNESSQLQSDLLSFLLAVLSLCI